MLASLTLLGSGSKRAYGTLRAAGILLLALSGRDGRSAGGPLPGTKRTSDGALGISANDPRRTSSLPGRERPDFATAGTGKIGHLR